MASSNCRFRRLETFIDVILRYVVQYLNIITVINLIIAYTKLLRIPNAVIIPKKSNPIGATYPSILTPEVVVSLEYFGEFVQDHTFTLLLNTARN